MSATVIENVGALDTTHTTIISCTTPTPPRLATNGLSQGSTVTTTPPATHGTIAPSYRFLYRGALSLPDSLLALDGLTFAARLDSPLKQSTSHLLENPLALALESMRGRPTLRFMGTIDLKDIYMDESGGVEMDIHPLATLSQIYFENMFCLQSFPTTSTSDHNRPQTSEIGVKVALGDSNGPETTQIVIYAQVSCFSANKQTIRLCVARITQRPASVVKPRGPRPDDPIPRKPPAFFIRDLKKSGSLTGIGARDLKRVASSTTLGVAPPKKQKLANGSGIAADLGSDVRLGAVNLEGDVVFKVPELPKQARVNGNRKEKGKEKEREKDVFGDISEVQRVSAAEPKSGKGKQKTDEPSNEAAMEKANKNAVKRATIEYLGKTKDPTDQSRTVEKGHPEHKELYNFIYRGVCFALRAKIRTCLIENGLISGLIDKHALMYLGGHGGLASGHGP